MPNRPDHSDQDASKGAVEQDGPPNMTNTSLSGQLPHRTENRLVKEHDSDFPEPGGNPEHTGEPGSTALTRQNSQHDAGEQDPGERQRRNQGSGGSDPRAA